MHEIHLARSDEEILATYPVMQQLRPRVTQEAYVATVRDQEQLTGYRLLAMRAGPRVVAVAGFRVAASLAWGRFVYVDDLVSDAALRSAGHGAVLLEWLADFGRAHGCGELHLDSGVQRFDAHRFYLRQRMDISCHHFQLKL